MSAVADQVLSTLRIAHIRRPARPAVAHHRAIAERDMWDRMRTKPPAGVDAAAWADFCANRYEAMATIVNALE